MQVDHDVVEGAARQVDRLRDSLRVQIGHVQRVVGQVDHPDARRMSGRDVEHRCGLAALGLVLPGVGHRADLLQSEGRRHVARDSVSVNEQDALVLAELERRREVGRDRGLAYAALRAEDGHDRRPPRPVAELDAGRLQDRAAAVVDGLRADAHRLDAPANGLGGVRSREVLVVDRRLRDVGGQAVHRPWRDDHQRGN